MDGTHEPEWNRGRNRGGAERTRIRGGQAYSERKGGKKEDAPTQKEEKRAKKERLCTENCPARQSTKIPQPARLRAFLFIPAAVPVFSCNAYRQPVRCPAGRYPCRPVCFGFVVLQGIALVVRCALSLLFGGALPCCRGGACPCRPRRLLVPGPCQFCVRYSLGDCPTHFLNRRVKCCG